MAKVHLKLRQNFKQISEQLNGKASACLAEEVGSIPTSLTKFTTMKKQEGLGDTIAAITEATGIDKVVKAVVGEDCGCNERREKLNKRFPYRKNNNGNIK